MDAQMSNSMSNSMSNASSSRLSMEGAHADETLFSPAEREVLVALRARYQTVGDLTPDEVARLQFVRWLYQTGRVEP